MFIVQNNYPDGIFNELVHIGTDRTKAEDEFISTCETVITNWGEYTPEDIEAVLDAGVAKYGAGVIMFIDTDGFTSDDKLRAMLTGQPPQTVEKITKWLRTGEIGEVATISEVLDRAGNLLDKSESYEICGEVVFEAEDGHTYVATTEVMIGLANPDYLRDLLAQETGDDSVDTEDS